MAEEQNFESLFQAALAELETTAQQPTAEEPTEGNAEPAQANVTEPVAEAEAVGETEAGEEETPASTESSDAEKAKSGPIAVTEEDVIVLPDGTEVSVKEAALRQADYTRKTQALSEERKAFDAERAGAQAAVEYVENLTKSWQANQAEVVSGFVASTQDPTLVLSQVIVELAKTDKLDPQFMETFGITPEIREKWAGEAKNQSELADVKNRLERFEREKQAVEQATNAKAQEDALITEYENQWAQIKVANNLNLDPVQDVEVKLEVLQYALANEIPNLSAAWKALQFEKGQTAKAAPSKNAAVDAKKAASGAISSKSSGGSVVTAKAPGNIEDAVWTAFNELTSRK